MLRKGSSRALKVTVIYTQKDEDKAYILVSRKESRFKLGLKTYAVCISSHLILEPVDHVERYAVITLRRC